MRATIIGLAMLLALAAAGCGGSGSSPEDEARDTVKTYLAALAASGDYAKACEQLDVTAQDDVEDEARASGFDASSCETALSEGLASADTTPLAKAAVQSSRRTAAFVYVTVTGGREVQLVEAGGAWRIFALPSP